MSVARTVGLLTLGWVAGIWHWSLARHHSVLATVGASVAVFALFVVGAMAEDRCRREAAQHNHEERKR